MTRFSISRWKKNDWNKDLSMEVKEEEEKKKKLLWYSRIRR
jgi:hypothetical protein